MKKDSGKQNALLRFVTRHKLITALIMCILFSFAYIAANGFMITSGNDDLCVSEVIYAGNTAVPCLGYFYTAFCVLIRPLFGALNMYMILQEIICFFSLAAINYFFIAKLGAKKGLFYTAVFDAVFPSFIIVEILYTYTAVLASTAGLLCLFYGSVYEKRRRVKTLQLICGFFLLLTGSQLRFSPFAVCCGIGAVYAAGVFVSRVAKSKKTDGVKKAFKSALKKYVITGILLIAAFVCAFGLNVVSDLFKNSSEDYRELSQYYESLSAVNDSGVKPNYKDPEKLDEIGLKSVEDINTLKEWFVDDSFYTVDRLDRLSEYIDESAYDGLLKKSVFEKTLYPLTAAFSQMIKTKAILLYLFVLIILIFTTVILSILFPRIKWLLIKLLLLTFLWSFFFLISDVFAVKSILLLPLMALSLLITLRYDRFQAGITLFLIVGLLIPYAYLVCVRLYFYTSFVPIFSVFVLMIFGLNEENLIDLGKKPKLKKTAVSVSAILVAAVSVFTGVFLYIDYVRVEDTKSNPLIEEYIETHPDTLFLVNRRHLMKSYQDCFILPQDHSNVLDYGLWLTKAKCFKDAQKANGIDELFKDAIDSNMRIVIWEENVSDDQDSHSFPIYNMTVYYNNHYAENGEVIQLNRTERIGNYSLYEVASAEQSQ